MVPYNAILPPRVPSPPPPTPPPPHEEPEEEEVSSSSSANSTPEVRPRQRQRSLSDFFPDIIGANLATPNDILYNNNAGERRPTLTIRFNGCKITYTDRDIADLTHQFGGRVPMQALRYALGGATTFQRCRFQDWEDEDLIWAYLRIHNTAAKIIFVKCKFKMRRRTLWEIVENHIRRMVGSNHHFNWAENTVSIERSQSRFFRTFRIKDIADVVALIQFQLS